MDLIDSCGQAVAAHLGCGYAGQEPQNKDMIPAAGVVVIERIGGGMAQFGRADTPWVQFTVLARTKKQAWDMLREIRALWAQPRTQIAGHFIYGVAEVLNPENANLPSDPFYRVRCTFSFHIKGLA